LKRLAGRGVLTSIFHWGTVITSQSARLIDGWCNGNQVDIEREMMRLTLKIVLKVVLDSETEEVAEAWDTLVERMDWRTLPLIDDVLKKVAFGPIHRFNNARARFDSIIYRLIRTRRIAGIIGSDTLSMLLQVRDEVSGRALTDEEIRDDTVTTLFAGHEPTAHALTWTWYLLSQHPAEQAKLNAELDAVLHGRLPNVNDLEALRYTRMIFSEAMRLYPPLWIVSG
jgi:cytochrome P450